MKRCLKIATKSLLNKIAQNGYNFILDIEGSKVKQGQLKE